MQNSNKNLFLLDAYALIYRGYYALIKNPRVNSKGMNTSAILGFVNTLEEVLKKENPQFIAIGFDPSGPTFRHEAYPAYKAQREETPEDIRKSVPIIKKIIQAYNIPILEVPGYEADDVIGTMALKAGASGIPTYMITPDKDYGQLVRDNVFMYRPKHSGGYEIMGIEEVKAKFKIEDTAQVIDLLGLMGDSSDNIPGCPGVGEKTAQKLISEFGSIENLLSNTDQLKGALKTKIKENKEKIVFSKFLATIKTDVPISYEIEDLERKTPDIPALTQIFEELEFRTLLEKIKAKEKKPAPVQYDLFGQPVSSPTPASIKTAETPPAQLDLFAEIQPAEQEAQNFSILTTLEKQSYKYYLVDNQEKLTTFIRKILTVDTFSFDTETTSVDAVSAELVGLSFSVKAWEAYYIPIPPSRDEAMRILSQLKPVYENPSTTKVGQNMKYDIIVLSRYGIEVQGSLFDTMLAHYVIQPELKHNMDYLAEAYLNYKTIHIEQLIGERGKNQLNMRDLTPEQICNYACEDADITLQLKQVLETELRKNNAEELFYHIEMPLVPVLAQMEVNGVTINTESLKQSSVHFSQRLALLEQEIYRLAGETFNIASPKQVGDILFGKLKIVEKPKKTKSGQFITSEEVLQGLKGKHPVVEKILDHRGLKKLLSTYISTLPDLINPETGRIHPSFNQAVTATGRLSSSNPNLQNIPIRDEDGKEIRKAFIPDAGCTFFSADYSQIELRIMAHLSQDQAMIEAFNSGQDIHAATAAKVYKVPIEEVTADMRRKAKTANFGIIYGISVFGLAERMNVSRGEAKELIDEYFATYPNIKAYMETCKEEARRLGYVETVFHRKRYLPDINSHNATVRGYAERNAINAPIQGSAADIIKVAMARIYRRFKQENIRSKMILQVHDELNFSVLPEEKDLVRQIVIEEMERAYPLSVPLKADCGWGTNWLEAH
ncbi:MAG: DNA polymerase I [Bacteroidales bacterium]|nr:DNA polymerase I [Bacteroidales bacterium]